MVASEKNENTTDVAEVTDPEAVETKLPWPKQIIFIVTNEFCERFMYYGMRTILVLYLTRKLFFSEDTATVIYHVFTSLVYFCCVIGAIIADSWLGKFRTIVYLSIVYVVGSFVIAIGAIETLNLPMVAFTIIGLVLIAFGSGGIKPCVAAFGGDQFKLPEQAKYVAVFFSIFYFAINSGSLVSTTVTPILREDLHCFGVEDCFPVAFGVPGVLMFTSILIFISGKFMYVMKAPSGNMFVLVCKCIGTALSTKRKEKKTNPKDDWLDYAVAKHGTKLVDETKAVLRVLFLYIPLPMFWALFDQQGSRWTFQATRMDGAVGSSFTFKPDQMQVVNPLLILIFIPLYEVVFYPILNRIGIRRPLQKLVLGGVLAGVAFIISAVVEIQLEKTYPVMPIEGQNQFRIFNGLPCESTITTNMPGFTAPFQLSSMDFAKLDVNITRRIETFNFRIEAACGETYNGNVDLTTDTAISMFIRNDHNSAQNPIETFLYNDDPSKSSNGLPLFRLLANIAKTPASVHLFDSTSDSLDPRYENVTTWTNLNNIADGKYDLYIDDKLVAGGTIDLKLGGSYTIVVAENANGVYEKQLLTISEPNSVHMMWLIPQYVVLTLGEVMYSVTGLEFSYSQAPPNMKSVLQGGWQLTVGVGNLIVAIVAEVKIFESQTNEFFLFAGLMFVDMAIFAFMAYSYTYVDPNKVWETDEDNKNTTEALDDNPTSGIMAIPGLVEKTSGIDNAAFKTD